MLLSVQSQSYDNLDFLYIPGPLDFLSSMPLIVKEGLFLTTFLVVIIAAKVQTVRISTIKIILSMPKDFFHIGSVSVAFFIFITRFATTVYPKINPTRLPMIATKNPYAP